MAEEILKLKGKAAKRFLEYDSRDLSKEEKLANKKAHQHYLKHCKS